MNKLTSKQLPDGEVVAFDIGDSRIGVARVRTSVNLPEPLTHIEVTPTDQLSSVLKAIKAHDPIAVVIGLPRGLEGQETAQTAHIRSFVSRLKAETEIPIYLIDEAGTSKEARHRLNGRPGSVDSVAAMIMLEDFMNNQNVQDLLV